MDAGTHNLRVIFGQERRHVVPLFQRPYVWTQQAQWSPLWDDLRAVADRVATGQAMRPHFMGAIVLDQSDLPYGSIETRSIIDGQQRLTTLQIVLEAFADCSGAHGLERYERAAQKLTRNEDPLNTNEDHVFKVWPTTADQDHFRRVMRARTPAQVLKEYGVQNATAVGHPIADAYLYFYRQIDEWFKEEPDRTQQRTDALFTTLKEAIRLVVIDLKEGDDAQVIFETLNARGTPLLPADLIKNYLFIRATHEKLPHGKLYERYWAQFDNDSNYWRQIVGRGHAQRPRLDLFMQYYLTLKTRDEVPVAHLYREFKGYCASHPNVTAEDHFKDISKYAAVFRSFDGFSSKSRQGQFMRRLAAMDTGTAYPFLLELFAQLDLSSRALTRSLDMIESFLVRRMICQMNTRGYSRFFADLLPVFEGEPGTIDARLEALLSAGRVDSNLWPSDDEVRQALRETPVYKALVRARVNMLLEALNGAMHDGKTEQYLLEALTIEHLMPQSWTANWPLPNSSEATVAERNRLIHSLGNLTLLTRKLNPSVSNGAWTTKREEILKYSALNLNRDLPADWNEDAIKMRTEQLSSRACSTWDAPPAVRSAGIRTVIVRAPETDTNHDMPGYSDDEEMRSSSQRQIILQRFWTSLLQRAKGKTPLLANRSPTTDSWLSAPSGRGGFWFTLSITQERGQVECFIRVKNGQDVHNKAIFHMLEEQKSAIEAEFGGALDWQELPGRIGCRICTTIPASWLREAEWPAVQDTMIELLIRLERAMRGPIHEVNVEAVLAADSA